MWHVGEPTGICEREGNIIKRLRCFKFKRAICFILFSPECIWNVVLRTTTGFNGVEKVIAFAGNFILKMYTLQTMMLQLFILKLMHGLQSVRFIKIIYARRLSPPKLR